MLCENANKRTSTLDWWSFWTRFLAASKKKSKRIMYRSIRLKMCVDVMRAQKSFRDICEYPESYPLWHESSTARKNLRAWDVESGYTSVSRGSINVNFCVGNRGCYSCKVAVSLEILSESRGYFSLNDGIILFDEVGLACLICRPANGSTWHGGYDSWPNTFEETS